MKDDLTKIVSAANLDAINKRLQQLLLDMQNVCGGALLLPEPDKRRLWHDKDFRKALGKAHLLAMACAVKPGGTIQNLTTVKTSPSLPFPPDLQWMINNTKEIDAKWGDAFYDVQIQAADEVAADRKGGESNGQ